MPDLQTDSLPRGVAWGQAVLSVTVTRRWQTLLFQEPPWCAPRGQRLNFAALIRRDAAFGDNLFTNPAQDLFPPWALC